MYRIECPGCGGRLKYGDEHVGRKAKCQKCGCSFRLPLPTLVQDAAPGRPASRSAPPWAEGVSPKPAAPPLPPKPRIAHGRWPWLAAGGGAMLVLAGFTVWLLIGGEDPGEGYSGPPPSVEFEVKGYKVASAVPFHGDLQIRDSKMVPPPAPGGYEFTTEYKEIPGGPNAFGWKATSGVLLLVSCKLTVKESSPGLEEIRLVRGNREIATLDGVVQSGFDKATAKDLNDGLAECHKNGKTPTLALVFRVADGPTANPAKLAIEICWQNREGKTLSGRLSLKNASRIPEESRKEPSADKPPTYEGEWSGEPSAEPHVSAIVVQKNTFPCLGEVRFAHKGGGKFDKPDEDFSFQNNRVRVRGVDDVEVTSPVEWSKEGDELVGTHAHSKEVVARIKLSGPLLVGEAQVPSAVRLLLGNANKLTISNLKKGND